MALGTLNISTGNIDVMGGGFGNKGVSGKDLAAIEGAQAQAQAIQAERERQERQQKHKLLIISGSMVVSVIAIVALYFFTKPKSKA